ncbi:uncharacterized protein LOC134659791 isoform X1 [Cydia amplana]|uniref:uncharacterized protein LOC134659791 isoform X1 n=1 Tax=Cydia amplana TaxID=1869771 RepID=UPI002FE5248D
MSMREEDRQKNNCPSRGLGLAAAALGVGVGAALYYFLSKKPENPDGEGSTTGWSCEQPHTFNFLFNDTDTSMENNCNTSTTSFEDSYTTISEATTTDTSIHSDSEDSYIDVIPNIEASFSFSEDEWDVTGSLDVPSEERSSVSPVRMIIGSFGALFSPRPSERRGRRT